MPTYVFPGQGSQFKGMGRELFGQFPHLTVRANEILGYSIEQLCVENPNGQLDQTQYTQPALYVVNAFTYLKKIAENKPQFVAGHSLGEYNALFAAGVFDFETGLKLVQKRGELMSQARDGAMLAIVGLKTQTIKDLLFHHDLQISIANYNSHTQVVLSGLKTEIEQAKKIFEQARAMLVLPLKVSGAFHSTHMKSAQESFRHFVNQFTFSPPQIPVIANTTALPYTFYDVAHQLTQQITQPVRWTDSIEYLLQQNEIEFEEIGPGTVLTGLIRRIKNNQ